MRPGEYEGCILPRLRALSDAGYAQFTRRLIPTVDGGRILGVRTPALRALARELSGTPCADAFMERLPHAWHEENNLHAFLIERIADAERAMAAVERFLPHIDNWATCDSMNPKALAARPDALLERACAWMDSKAVYTARYGIGVLMRHFLDERFEPWQLERVAQIAPGEYYVDMMRAWYVATALAKRYDAALELLCSGALDVWTHNKAISKAIESRRIDAERKSELRKLKRQNP
ncbi:MAG: DNA alkylation repair protein [Clostridia bacterium]|nr:DNA alkylation repair protein [Clostridia bacterium]